MKKWLESLWQTILANSLWLVGLGLMLASSGIDGAYMAQWMQPNAHALGYILNTVSDIAGMTLMYWYGRLAQTPRNAKGGALIRFMSRFILAAEIVAVGYSWFFSWRQLRRVMYGVESMPLAGKFGSTLAGAVEVEIVAAIAAGFIPLLLAFVGYAQSLLAGRIDDARPAQDDTRVQELRAELKQARAALEQSRTLKDAEFTDFVQVYANSNGALRDMAPSDGNAALVRAGFAPLAESTWRNWREKVLNSTLECT